MLSDMFLVFQKKKKCYKESEEQLKKIKIVKSVFIKKVSYIRKFFKYV